MRGAWLTILDWGKISNAERTYTCKGLLGQLDSEDGNARQPALASLAYIAMGNYGVISSVQDHIYRIKINTRFLWKNGSLGPIYKLLTRCINLKVPDTLFTFDATEGLDDELSNCLTILYFMIETNRHDAQFAKDLDTLDPPILQFLIRAIGRLRWGVSGNLPLREMFLLFWKVMVGLFGDTAKLESVKKYMRRKYKLSENSADPNTVTASPLDYHAFRQDIMQRYPAYVPPPSKVPQGVDNVHSMSQYIEIPRPIHAQTQNTALPAPVVHIATPAPSPPATPAIVPGQRAKKSLFMTNTGFPFIHPTQGNETVPQSIIEASELFAARVQTEPEMVQLWAERDLFMRQERGWLMGEEETEEEMEDTGDGDQDEETILRRIEKVYVDTIPQLNAFIVVILKFMLASISATSQEGITIDTYLATHQGVAAPGHVKQIALKAVSSVLELMTEWYKVSHIVKFEYMSALLFDSRYYLLVYKYFYSHDQVDEVKKEDPRKGFWYSTARLSTAWIGSPSSLLVSSSARRPCAAEKVGPVHEKEEQEEVPEERLFSRRYFLVTINLLRVLRKTTASRTQRVIMVAELPPQSLRRALCVYQAEMWELALSIVKAGVPFSGGRRWRYRNMALVSAIYMHCGTTLRDDWLGAGDADQEIEDALPQEMAVRALIQFYNERRRRGVKSKATAETGPEESWERSEPDFFGMELEALSMERS